MTTRLIVLAPGAGAPSSSGWMRAMAERLAAFGRVEAFDYPYQIAGRRSPDRPPVLVAAHQEALARARSGHGGPFVLAGKSMGGRIGCHVAVESEPKPNALVCLGYPLVGQNGSVRDEVLLALRTPVLFVQGTRDALCPLERLEAVRSRMRAPNRLHVVEGGDHSLLVQRRALSAMGKTQADVDRAIDAAIGAFLTAEA
ncbi:MAG TPA: alpha/beta fold hydrolase [Polyangiaceae bacterium]